MQIEAFSKTTSLGLRHHGVCLWCLSVAMVLGLASQCYSQQSHFLVLKNGQIVEGKAEYQQGQTTIIKASGSRMVFDASRIACLCTTADQAYWEKYATLSATDAGGHIQLFEWCLRRELFKEATNELNVLKVMNVSAARLRQLEERLLTQQQAPSSDVKTASTAAPGVIQRVGYNAELTGVERAKFLKAIEDATDNLPDEAVVQFKRKIEPLVIRTCYTAKCHDRGAAEMPLTAINKSLPVPKRMSQRNLYSILKHTDFDAPLESAFLAAAATAHGGQKVATFEVGSPQLGTLARWLIAISSNPQAYHQPPARFFNTDLQVVRDGPASEETSPPAKAPEMDADARKLPSSKTTNTPAPSGNGTESADPFDPETFNRRYVRNRNGNNHD